MYRFIGEIFRRLRHDERGNVFVLFGATAIPLLLIMGGAVDFARYTRYKTDLSNAVDSASLALARQHPEYTADQAKTFVTNYVNAMNVADNQLTITSFDALKNDNGFTITANGSMRTMFLPLGKLAKNGNGINSISLNISATVVNASSRLEVALVMDNTGSMNCGASLGACITDWSSPGSDSRIVAVKDAAKKLVDVIMPDNLDDKNLVKIAIVPFEGQVNVASAGFDVDNPPSWIQWADAAGPTWEGMNFGKRNTSTGASCTTGTSCKYIGHKWLFNQIKQRQPTVKWAGCVEMRGGSYELSDAAPNASIPDSLFVPYFAPDEPDSPTTAGSSGATRYNYDSNGSSTGGTQYTYANDYLSDKTAATPANAQKSFDKYRFHTASSVNYPRFWSGRMDVEGLLSPYEYGPNRGCPRPIYPLANADYKTTIKSQIDSMIAYWHSGTFLPTGLVWGWHVLSPGIPYTEGTKPGDQYYDKTVKAIVFFTDGENDISADDNPNLSRYNGYNYVNTTDAAGNRRLGTSASAGISALDTKTATLCTNVKTNGTAGTTTDDIRLYVITFGTISSDTSTLMTNCASLDNGTRLYYHAPTTADLNDIFDQIGKDLSDIHLSM